MAGLTALAVPLVVAFAAAAAAFPFLAAPRVVRTAALVGAGAVVLASPLLVPAGPLRLAAALAAAALAPKLFDLHTDPGRAGRFTHPAFLAYLANWLNLVPRKNPPRPARPGGGRRLTAGLLTLAAGGVLTAATFAAPWAAVPWPAEHAAKVAALYLAVSGAGAAAAEGWRLAGAAALDPMAGPLLAPTPAEFWRRWNRPAQQFFYEDVFKPCGGRRAPARATLATFAASAAVHEYVFGVAAGRPQGWQAAFFLLHGVAAAATLRVRPTGVRRAAGTALTLAFVLTSSALFFRSVDAVVPFYDRTREHGGRETASGDQLHVDEGGGPAPSRRRARTRSGTWLGGSTGGRAAGGVRGGGRLPWVGPPAALPHRPAVLPPAGAGRAERRWGPSRHPSGRNYVRRPRRDRGAGVAVADVSDTPALRDARRRGTRLFLLNPPAAPATDTAAEERRTLAAVLAALDGVRAERVVAQSTYGVQPGGRG